jgi:hypothetical protein
VSPQATAQPPVPGASRGVKDDRFLLSAISFLRSKQLMKGAAARIARDGHKPTYLAVFEVLSSAISWSRV